MIRIIPIERYTIKTLREFLTQDEIWFIRFYIISKIKGFLGFVIQKILKMKKYSQKQEKVAKLNQKQKT